MAPSAEIGKQIVMGNRWLVEIVGDEFDLHIIKDGLKNGLVDIVELDEHIYLTSSEWNSLDSTGAVSSAANEMIASINVAFKTAVDDYGSIVLGTFVRERVDKKLITHVFLRPETGRFKARGYIGTPTVRDINGVIIPPKVRPLSLRILALCNGNDRYRKVLHAFNAEPANFRDLYIAYEFIRKCNPGPEKTPHKKLVDNQWATEEECNLFWKSAHHYRHADVPLPVPAMPIEDAVAFIRKLIIAWTGHLLPV